MEYGQSRKSEVKVTVGGILLCAVVAAVSFFYAKVEPFEPSLPVAELTASQTG